MKILFLGTAAAEGWPGIFCRCAVCRRAREAGGRNIRTRSSCIIDDTLMVDFPPDTYLHALKNNLSLDKIAHLIITHSHEDHFFPADLRMRRQPFAHLAADSVPRLTVYGNSAVSQALAFAETEPDMPAVLAIREVRPFQPFTAGTACITPLLAAHMENEQCFLYLINSNGKTLLYGHDTGYFPEQTWEFLAGTHLDAALFDCTYGPEDNDIGHMGFPAVRRVRDRLVSQGSGDAQTRWVITHFSHNGGLLHEELEALASPHGFLTAYDGLELVVE